MVKRRGNQDGTFCKRPNGTWCGQVMIDNKRYTVYGKGIQECKKKLREKINSTKPTDKTDFITFALQFFQEQLDKKIIKPNTHYFKVRHISRLNEYLKGLTVSSITTADVQVIANALMGKNHTKGVITTTLSVILSVVSHAYYMNLRTKPIRIRDIKFTGGKKKRSFIPFKEVHKRIQSISNPLYRFAFDLMLHTGLRIGEALALEWSDIDIDKGIIYVNKNKCYVNSELQYISTPKSNRVGDKIKLPDSFIPIIKEYKAKSKYPQVLAGRNGVVYTPCTFRIQLKKLFKDTTCSTGTHQLRHLYASYLLQNNINLKTIQLQLRHHSLQTTEKYLHEIDENFRAEIAKLNF